jgi:hypothetical protein
MKTDNSHLQEKIDLRMDAVDGIGKDSIRVLELFAGKSVLWTHVKNERPVMDIKVLSVEKEKGKNPLAINADNLKVIDNIDLSRFDIIDIDAYGIQFAQLDKIFRKGYHGIVVVTCISSMFGALPKGLVEANGISSKMYAKIPSIFSPKMFAYMENYLYLSGVQSVKGYFLDDERKYYFYFKT